MSEPPLPIVPTGEVRNFDLVLPETPGSPGPGSGEDPSGGAAQDECQAELAALVAALNAAPTTENALALALFIENQTGQPIEELVPAWDDTITDGQERTATIEVCGSEVTITISGTLTGTTTCAHLPSYGLRWPKTDFEMPCIVTDTFQFVCASPATQIHDLTYPDINVHLEDPEFVYVEPSAYYFPDVPNENVGLLGHLWNNGWAPNGGVRVGPPGDGSYYYPYLRVKHRWSCKIGSGYGTLHRADGPPGAECYEVEGGRTYWYYTQFPIMAFHPLLRYDGTPPAPDFPWGGWNEIDDPLQLGTIVPGFSGGFSSSDSDLPTTAVDVSNVPGNTWPQRDRDHSNDFSYALHIEANTDPDEDGFVDETQILRFDSQSRQSDEEAWDEFVVTIEDYQSSFGDDPYAPVVTLDEENMVVHVSCETDENALYLPVPACGTTPKDDNSGPTPYVSWVVSWGGWWMNKDWRSRPFWGVYFGEESGIHAGQFGYLANQGFLTDPLWMTGFTARMLFEFPEDNADYFMTEYRRVLSINAGQYIPEIEGSTEPTTPTDGKPPDTETNPPIVPVGGGCRSSLNGPSSCSWNVPVPASPQPEVPEVPSPDVPIPNVPNFPMPGDNFPDVPVIRTDLPNIPNLPCIVPDFGNIDPCGAGTGAGGSSAGPNGSGAGGGPGFMGSLPGGRDRMGHRGSAGTVASIKTGGQTYQARDYLFTEETCPGIITPSIGCMAVITQLLMDCGIAPIDIIFQIGPEWDKLFPADKCFTRGSRIFDAAMWTARYIMCTIVDEGPPTNDVYIGPPWHRPLQTVWTFDEHYDLFNISRGLSAEEPYGWVEVFGPNVTSPVIVRIEDPFSTVDSPTLRLEVGANYSQTDAEGLGAYKASEIRREAVGIQATVPYSSEYFLRDLMLIAAPDKGFQETYVITGKQSDISAAGRFHILTGMLPATLAELDAFPEVTDEYDAIEGGFA